MRLFGLKKKMQMPNDGSKVHVYWINEKKISIHTLTVWTKYTGWVSIFVHDVLKWGEALHL